MSIFGLAGTSFTTWTWIREAIRPFLSDIFGCGERVDIISEHAFGGQVRYTICGGIAACMCRSWRSDSDGCGCCPPLLSAAVSKIFSDEYLQITRGRSYVNDSIERKSLCPVGCS